MPHIIYILRTLLMAAALLMALPQARVCAQVPDMMPAAAPHDHSSEAADSATLEPAWPGSVAWRIGRLLDDSLFAQSQVALMVWDLTADSAIYSHNARQCLRPASTMKVVTAIAALDRLGGSHLFKTRLLYDGTVADRTLMGSVYLVGGFDPHFNGDDMRAMAEALQGMGVDTLRGRVVADKSMTDTLRWGEGWCWDDDNPTLSPLLIGRRDDFASRFLDELAELGVVVEAQCAEGAAPASAYEICTRTHTMDQVLLPMMRESDNLCAEAMFYQLAAATGAHPATAGHARRAIGWLLERIGLQPRHYRIADGSGLSLYNYVTVEMEVQLLRYAHQNANISTHLLPSLPVAAWSGTLKKRMRGTAADGNVKAKTGSVAAVSSLAGYCTAANGHELCFAIINQGMMRSKPARDFQDRVCDALCRE